MSNFEIKDHELIYLENKRKSKANSFYVLKFTEQNTINLTNKKINISKKNNSIELSSNDKKSFTIVNDKIKENLETYVNNNDISIKNNLTKIVFNDIMNNNKILFSLSDEIDSSLINKTNKYNCVLKACYIILIFTGQKSCEVSIKLSLISIKSDDTENEESDDNSTLLSDITMENNEKNNKKKKNVITVDTNDNNKNIVKKRGRPAKTEQKK
jgi:hypothetical protein